jgi:2-polyprenyl-6-methoxyphenol hydroxylase-like FAD-dependent oxidoreductase
MSSDKLDVLICGAGPVGLTLATMLHYQGIDNFRIIDKAPAPSDKSKALVVWPRTLELMEKPGLVSALMESGILSHGVNIYADGKRLLHFSLDRIDSPYNAALFIPQDQTERVLNEHIASLNHGVERQVELISFKDDGNGVDCVLRHADGREESIRTAYLAGCDGAHSTVRHVLQMPFEGHTLKSGWALADVHIEGAIAEDELSVFWDNEGIVAVFPMGHERFRIIIDLSPDAKVDEAPTLESIQKIIDVRVKRGWKLTHPLWLTNFTINERKVKDYSRGRCFLAGDAAHIHSPAGGQGMNTGMQDACNLAWKLALVLRNQAPASLLDSYNVERTAIGEEIVGNADKMTTVATLRGSVKQHVRNSIVRFLGNLHLVEQKMTNQLAELSICYPNSPIVGQHKDRLSWVLSRGVAPGLRAVDGPLQDPKTDKPTQLFEAFKTPRHVMLLFAGLHFTEEDNATLLSLAKSVSERYGAQIEPVMVSVDAIDEWSGKACLDPEGETHRLYGAAHAAVYVIRPDGYVGFRSQPVDAASLDQWLGNIFLAAEPAVAG